MQWHHKLDHMQTICTSLQTDNHTNATLPTPHHSIFTGQMLFLALNQQCQTTEGDSYSGRKLVLVKGTLRLVRPLASPDPYGHHWMSLKFTALGTILETTRFPVSKRDHANALCQPTAAHLHYHSHTVQTFGASKHELSLINPHDGIML